MVATSEMDQIADVVFVIEGTAINGAYINDLKENYIVPTLEYFSHGVIDDRDFYLNDRTSTMYGIILYRTAQVGLGVSCLTHGPFSSPQKVLNTIDRLELTGGRSESNANLAEGMATALICFDDFDEKRENNISIHKHCILICNSPPYSMPVMDCFLYENKNVEQLATIFQDKNIHLSILSPRKIPILFKLFEKAGGDLNLSTTKNYCKDPRHLVLLNGYSLEERPISPSMQGNGQTTQLGPNFIAIGSKESPQISVAKAIAPRPMQSGGIDSSQQPGGMQPQFVNQTGPQIQQTPGGIMQQNPIISSMGYINSQMQQTQPRGVANRAWLLQQSQQRHFGPTQLQQQGQSAIQQNSALISQLTTPPHPMTNPLNNSQMQSMNQQQLIRMLSQQQMLQNQQLQQQQQNNQNILNPGMQQQQPNLGSVMINHMNSQQIVQPQQLQQNQTQQQTVQQNRPVQIVQPQPTRKKIWTGIIEWSEKMKTESKVTRHIVPCYVSTSLKDGELDIKADNWPQRLIMQLMPKQLIGSIGEQYIKDAKTVVFHPSACDSLDALSKVLFSGFAGCVHFNTTPNQQCDIKILILLFVNEKKAFLGFIPNNQIGFVDRLRKVIAQKQGTNRLVQGPQHQSSQSGQQAIQQQGGGALPNSSQAQNPQMLQMVQDSSAQMQSVQQNQQIQQAGSRMGLVNLPALQQQQTMGNQNQLQNMRGPSPSQMQQQPQQQQRFEFDQRQQGNMDKMSHLKQPLDQVYDSYGQIPMQMQETMQSVQQQQQQSQQDQYKLLMMQQQQQQRNNMSNNPQGNQLNQQRMIRPGVPGASNPGLRHLLQQQQQQPQNTQQYRQVMGMQQQNIGQMGDVSRPQNQQSGQQFEESFDFFVNNE